MSSLQWIFNATRQPGVGLDSMCRCPGNDYVLVLKQVELFQVQLRKGGQNEYLQEIEATIDAIISRFEIFDDSLLHSSSVAKAKPSPGGSSKQSPVTQLLWKSSRRQPL